MDEQRLQDEFDYQGTAQGLVDYLWQLTQNQYAKFQAHLISWDETYPHPYVERRRDNTPFLVEYRGNRRITFIDSADGQERTASESVLGITFELDPLPNGYTHVKASCHHQAFEEWYSYLLGLFGVQTRDEAPANETQSFMVMRPHEILKHLNDIAPRGKKEWWDGFFAWYTDYTGKGFRYTQDDLARLSGYSLQHLKRKLGEWRGEHETT